MKKIILFSTTGHKFRLGRQAAQLSFSPKGYKFRMSRQAAQLSFILLSLFWTSTAFAEELVVRLTSGNAVVIQYTGTIQGVTFQGKSDAIAGLDMPNAAKPTAKSQQPAAEKQPVIPQPEQAEAKKSEEKWFRFKWAEPKGED